jgi:hypothetical protein
MKEGTAFFRCQLCGEVVSPWDINKGGCQVCGGVKIVPTNLSFVEKLKQIVRHPAVWAWPQ